MRYAAGVARGNAPACFPLIGAPSDRSGGAAITLALDALRVEATAEPGLGLELIVDGGQVDLVRAAMRQLLAGRSDLSELGLRLELTDSGVPRGVGLGDRTATVLATLQALDGLFGIGLAREQLAPLALACLTDQLGEPGSLRDPVAQTEGGLTFMDFDPDGGGRYEPLDPNLLPPLFVAWPTDPEPAGQPPSGAVDAELGEGEAAELAGLAQRALSPLLIRDGAGFGVLLERDRELHETAEPANPLATAVSEVGAAVNSSSPTGAVAGLFRDEAQLEQIRAAVAGLGAELLVVRPG